MSHNGGGRTEEALRQTNRSPIQLGDKVRLLVDEPYPYLGFKRGGKCSLDSRPMQEAYLVHGEEFVVKAGTQGIAFQVTHCGILFQWNPKKHEVNARYTWVDPSKLEKI